MCEEGHQIQGFGGNMHKVNNRAITYGCHELLDEDRVVWNNNDKSWRIFKDEIFAAK